jgi:y4mF family transcriptional regulator
VSSCSHIVPIGKRAARLAFFFPIGKSRPEIPRSFPIGMKRGPPPAIFPIGKQMAEPTKIYPTRVKSATDLGNIVRGARKRAVLDQEKTADLIGVGPRFLGELERGKPSVRLGLVLKVLERLGLEVWVSPRGWKP